MSQDSQNQESDGGPFGSLEDLYERFEQQCKQGPPPDLMDFLRQAPASQGAAVFAELLGIELEYRFRKGERPSVEEYAARYPQFRQQIDAIHAESRRRAEEFSAFTPQPGPQERKGMHIRCPHCHYPIEILDERSLDAVDCPICGSSLRKREAADTTSDTAGQQGRVIGQFELLEQLGEGTFGAVWKARDTIMERIVALKIPRVANLTGEELDRFIREARLAAQCEHPHIVRVYEVGFAGDVFCIASQLIEGESLREYLNHEKPDPRQAAEICRQIAEALHCAHEAGIVHRDLKPANILLDAARQPHITDFGLAKREVGELSITMSGMIVGTLQYMSPEQARGDSKSVDRRSDIYALGTILFELLTGEKPFRGTTETIFRQLAEDEPSRVCALNSQVSRDLEAVCLRCLEKDPRQRFQTAQELADELQRCLRGEPTRTRPVGHFGRAWRWCRRNPAVTGLTVAVFLALTLAAVVSAAFAATESARAERESELRDNADTARNDAETAQAETDVVNAYLRRSLVKSKRQAAQLAAERGQWRQSLKLLDEAAGIGHSDPVELQLGRIKALEALSDLPALGRAVEALADGNPGRSHRAEAWFWQGQWLRLSGQEETGLARLREALDDGLPEADAEYVRALLAESSPAAVQHLRRALQSDPFHHGAQVELVAVLVFSGEFQEARDRAAAARHLFPQDPNFPAFLALIAMFIGNTAEADRQIAECRQFGESFVTTLQLLGEVIAAVRDIEWTGSEPLSNVSVMKLSLTVVRLLPAMGDPADKARWSLPQSVKRAYQTVLSSLLPEISVKSLVDLLMRPQRAADLSALTQAQRLHPDAFFPFMRGCVLFEQGKWRECETACLEATQLKTAWIHMPRYAWLFAATAALKQWEADQSQREALERAGKYLERAVALGSVPRARTVYFCDLALLVRRHDLAGRIVDGRLRDAPDDPAVLPASSRVALAQGDYLKAIGIADRLLAKDPRHAQAQEVRRAAMAKLAATLSELRGGEGGSSRE